MKCSCINEREQKILTQAMAKEVGSIMDNMSSLSEPIQKHITTLLLEPAEKLLEGIVSLSRCE